MGFLIKYRLQLLLAVLALTVGFGWFAQGVRINFSFDSFNPKEDAEYQFYQRYKKLFPHEDNGIQVAFSNPSGSIWDLGFLQKVDSIFESLRDLPHLDTVLSPTRLKKYRRSGLGIKESALFVLDSDSAVLQGREVVEQDSILYVNFFSEKKSHIAGFVLVDTSILDKAERDEVSLALREKIEKNGLPHVISGVPYIRTQYVERIRSELVWFLAFSVSLSIVVMFWLFREWHGMLLPQLVVILTMVWLLGFMALTGYSLDLMSELLPSILFVVGISDCVHISTAYQQNLKKGEGKLAAMKLTLKEVGMAALLTSLTTAVGFVSMLLSPLPPLQDFGLLAAVAVMMAFVITLAILPSILLSVPESKMLGSKGASNDPRWEKAMTRLYHWIKVNGKWVLGGFGVLMLVSIVGMTQISTNSYLLDDVSEDDPAREAMNFFADNFYGTRSFEMEIAVPEGKSVTDLEVLQDLDRIERHLRSKERISPFLSIVGYLKGAYQLSRGSRPQFFRLPETQEKVDELVGMGYSFGGGDNLNWVMSPDQTRARMSAKMGDIGTYRFEALRNSMDSLIRATCRPGLFTYHLTGNAILAENNVKAMRGGLLDGIIFSFVVISILMGLLFRNWKMLIVSMIPNLVPLIAIAGLMGFAGITLRASSSIVFLVAFGIAVDDTIHFLSRFRMELQAGRDRETSILNAIKGSGKAMIVTSVILFSGFIFLLTSDFGATYIVGLFTAITLGVALFADLLLLPVLIRMAKIGPEQVETEQSGQAV